MNMAITPTDIRIDLKQRRLSIDWQDGHTSHLAFEMLRKECPCAVCNELRMEADSDPLRILSADQANASGDLDPKEPVQEVGRYALQFLWADGHRTGIYTYSLLRQLGEI